MRLVSILLALFIIIACTTARSRGLALPKNCFYGQSPTLKVNCILRQLTAFPDNIPPDIVRLDLSINKIPNVTYFPPLRKLTALNLGRNLIEVVSWESLCNLPNVDIINLKGNRIRKVELGICIKNLTKLVHLDLSHNKIASVTESDLGVLHTARVFLHFNPLRCDCNLLWLIRKVKCIHAHGPYESRCDAHFLNSHYDLNDIYCCSPDCLPLSSISIPGLSCALSNLTSITLKTSTQKLVSGAKGGGTRMHGINQTIQVSHLGITLDGNNGTAGTTQQSGHLNFTITQNGDGIASPKDEDITSLRESSTGGAVSKMAHPQADDILEMEGMNMSVRNLTMKSDETTHNQSYILVPACSMTQCGPFTHASPMVGVLHIVIMVVASLLSMAFPTCAIIKLIKQRRLQALKNKAAVTALTQNILQFHNPVYSSSDSIGRPPSTVQEADHNHVYEVIPPDYSGQEEPIAAAPVKLTKLIPPIQNAAYHSVTKNADK